MSEEQQWATRGTQQSLSTCNLMQISEVSGAHMISCEILWLSVGGEVNVAESKFTVLYDLFLPTCWDIIGKNAWKTEIVCNLIHALVVRLVHNMMHHALLQFIKTLQKLFKSLRSVRFFKVILSATKHLFDSKDIHNVTKDYHFKKCFFSFLFINKS